MTSQEIAELQAYELKNGPIGGQYSEGLLANIHEMLQQIARILVAQNVEDASDVPKLQRYPRPQDVVEAMVEDEGEDDA